MDEREKTTHQTWGLLNWNRFQGRQKFFGSDLNHDSGVTVELREAEVNRSLSQSWNFPLKLIASVRMTESQFAEFLTTPNRGTGVPCTIEHRSVGKWENMGPVKMMPSEYDMHREEGKKTVRESLNIVNDLKSQINDLKASAKAKDALLWQVELIERALGSSIDFVEESFEKRMSQIVQKAKTDIEAFNYHSRIANGMPVKAIEARND